MAILLAAAGCRATAPAAPVTVSAWGTMREVLREGRTEARVTPVQVVGPGAVGVGALAGLAGEVTVLDGRVLVATATGLSSEASGTCRVREAGPEDEAALLVLAEVPAWEEHELGAASSYGELEEAIARVLRQRGHDLAVAVPVRVRGRARELELHVLDGACPTAQPDGPPPWRWRGAADEVELVGFFAEGSAGRLTHHARASHLHAVVPGRMGHLDEVALEGAVLLLPAR